MKKGIFSFVTIVGFMLFVFASASVSSCKKDQTCHGKVTVHDTLGKGVPAADVRLDANSVGGQKVYNGKTDASGVVNFDVDLPAIFDVTVTKSTYVGQVGKGSLNLDEARKESEITIVLP